MNQFKRAKVVMLPTNEKASLHLHPKGFLYKSVEDFIQDSKKYKSYHLYIIINDKIKEGDWIYSKSRYNIGKVEEIQIATKYKFDYSMLYCEINNKEIWSKLVDCKKIIATTDSSLKIESELDAYYRNGLGGAKSLPQPSQQFIQKYVEEYNKGNIIVDVLVEYCFHYINECNCQKVDITDGCNDSNHCLINEIPKIKPKDNTITIKKIKDISSINFLDWYVKKEYWYAGNAYFISTGHKKSEFVCSTTSELYEMFLQDLKN